jgi:hypothetical protein
VNVLLLTAAAALLGFAAALVAGRLAWLVLVVVAGTVYVSVGTGNDVPPHWMVWAVLVIPFAFIGLGLGMRLRRWQERDVARRRV